MELGNILGKTYSDYKKNFRAILLLTLILVGIPLVFTNLVLYGFAMNDPVFYQAFVNEEVDSINPTFAIVIALISLITLVLYFIYEGGLIRDSIGGKFNFHKTTNAGKKYFWKFVWFGMVTIFFLMLLFLAFIIPGIIFSIYWALGIYVYFDSNKNVRESLRTSFKMVRGNWWRMVGYSLVLFLILGVIGAVMGLIAVPTELAVRASESPSLGLLFGSYILKDLVNFVYTLVSVPFMVLFYKNIYLELRGKGKKKKSSNKK